MGLLVEGEWKDVWYDTEETGGKFVRKDSQFRNWVTADGSPGPSGEGGFEAEADRYHLYVSLACPWAHRTLIFRRLKGLEDMIGLSIVDHHMGENGWEFRNREGGTADALHGFDMLWQVYAEAKPSYVGRVTVPVLWDKRTGTIVSNESSEIIRMFNSAFDGLDGVRNDLDFFPEHLRGDIDAINALVYDNVNNGVYKCGFATSQEAYRDAYDALFETLDSLDARLATNRYLLGDSLTEADWRLFTTLVRFDPVYVGHFKCNRKRIADYPALSGYLRELYQMPGIADTVNLNHIKKHYYGSHETINPTRIVPKGPDIDFNVPHGRDHLQSLYQMADFSALPSISSRRRRVAGVVSAGRSSGSKKPLSAISSLAVGGDVWTAFRHVNSTT